MRKIKFTIRKNELLEKYVDVGDYPSEFGGQSQTRFFYVPEWTLPLDKLPKFGFNDKEMKKIRNTFKNALIDFNFQAFSMDD